MMMMMFGVCVCTAAGDVTDPEDEEYEMLNMPPQRAVINGTVYLLT